MYQIDGSTAVTSEPTRGAVGPKPNAFFQDQATGGTIVDADFMNAVMKELAYFCTQAGLTLDKADDTQVHEALLRYLQGTSTNVVNPFMNYIHVQDRQTAGTAAQTLTLLSHTTRTLNTVIENNISGAVLSTNQVQLPAGDYRVDGFAPISLSASGQSPLLSRLRVRDTTGSATLALGGSPRDNTSIAGVSECGFMNTISGSFTLSATSSVELQHYNGSNKNASGGSAVNDGEQEVYAEMKIWKLD